MAQLKPLSQATTQMWISAAGQDLQAIGLSLEDGHLGRCLPT